MGDLFRPGSLSLGIAGARKEATFGLKAARGSRSWTRYSALALALCVSTVAATSAPSPSPSPSPVEPLAPFDIHAAVQQPYGLEHPVSEPSSIPPVDESRVPEDYFLYAAKVVKNRRGASPYLPTSETVYFHRWMPKLRAEYPELTDGDLGEKIGQGWLSLDLERRNVHKNVEMQIHREWETRQMRLFHYRENGEVLPPWFCDEGLGDAELIAPRFPLPAQEILRKEILCQKLEKDGQVSERELLRERNEKWTAMTAEEKESYIQQEQQQKDAYLTKWRKFAESEAVRRFAVPAWILPCNASSTGVVDPRLEEPFFFYEHAVKAKNPPEPQRGRRSPYMIYYMDSICRFAIEQPDSSIESIGQKIDQSFSNLTPEELQAYESKHLEYKKEFIDTWEQYWNQIFAYIADPQHKMERKNLYMLKFARPYEPFPLFAWDTEYKWLVEKRLPWMNPAMMTLAEMVWTELPAEGRKIYKDWDKDLKAKYQEVMGEPWGDPMKELSAGAEAGSQREEGV